MNIGLSSYTFPWAIGVAGFMPQKPMSIEDLLLETHRRGIDRLQLCDNISFEYIQEGIALAKSLNIQLEIGTRRLSTENLLAHLEICKQANSPFLRVVIDDADYHPNQAEVIEIIKTVLEEFRAAKVILAIENHDRFTVASLCEIIKQTDKNWVGICLDTANSIGAAEGIKEVVNGLAPHTVNLHCKDFTISRLSYKMGFVVEGCAAGQGMLDIPWVLEELKPYNRCISATLEVWSSPLDNIENTMLNEKQLVNQSLTYLTSIS